MYSMMQKTSSYDGHIFSTSIVTYVVAYYNIEIPFPSGNFCEIMKNGEGEEWLDLDVAGESALKILNKQMEDPTYIDRLISIFNKKRDVFLKFFGEFQTINLKEMSNEELLGMFHTFVHYYIDEYAIAGITYIYADALSEILFKKLDARFSSEASKIIASVTHPEVPTFLYSQRKEMLELMQKLISEFGIELFKKNKAELESIVKKSPNLYPELIAHSEKYFWKENNYKRKKLLGPIDFLEKMKDELISFKNLEEELKVIAEQEKEIIQNKQNYLSKLTVEELAIATLLEKGTTMQDDRKKCVLLANHIIYTFLEEVSRRTRIDYELLVNATPWELPKILNGEFDLGIIKERMNDWFSIYYDDKGSYADVGFMKGRKYDLPDHGEVSELRGTPASPGSIRGKVKVIVSESKFSKMNKGDILVSGMTRPEYIPVIGKAAGIITDEGGLTCHAAIVSREMKIPCIVGAKIATHVLKDGDEIELDANKGLIKILKRA